MSKSIKMNCDDVQNLSNKTLDNYSKFEESRNKIIELINSLPDCWEGVDANAFEKNFGNYVSLLKNDTDYFEYLAGYFKSASKTIDSTIDDHHEKFKRMDNEAKEVRR